MTDHLLTLMFLLVGAVSAQSEVQYYITPSLDSPCPKDPCLTLSQFAANSSNCTGNVSLIFLPGNHSLDSELKVSGADNFSMKPRDNELVTIECKSQSGQFVVYDTTFTSIKCLHFNGCGGNTVTKVKELLVKDSIFQGVEEGRGTALVLNEVNFAEIIRSSFISNTPGVNSEHHYVREFITDPDILQKLALEEDDLVSVGGALLTTSSNVSVTNTKFVLNEAEIGGVLLAYKSIITISQCTCRKNKARVMSTLETPVNNTSSKNAVDVNDSYFTDKRFGGSMFAVSGSLKIIDSIFTDNTAATGGVMFTLNGSVNITSSTFINNTAWTAVHTPVNELPSLFVDGIGGVIFTIDGSFIITCSNFSNNNATYNGGVMVTSGGAFNINSCVFTTNIAVQWGGFMGTHGGSFNITDSIFTNTTATDGGVMFTLNGSLSIFNSTFTGNTVRDRGGVGYTSGGSFNITNSTFTNNTAVYNGGVMSISTGSFDISNSTFTNNNAAAGQGGVMFTWGGSLNFNVTNSTFTNNTAAKDGGVLYLAQGGSFYIKNSSFRNNTAESYRGIIFVVESSTHVTDSTFHYNLGSLYTFNGNLTFSGQSKFENGFEPSNKTVGEGGALTCFQSTIIFSGEISLLNNQARQGGAILAIESTILLYGTTTIANNTATDSGGGISLQQSNFEIKGSCNVSDNFAMRGGGIHAKSSTISVYQKGGKLQLIDNNAENGSGLYLEINPKLYLLKNHTEGKVHRLIIIFTGNHAHYGGAVYVADDTNTGAYLPNIECFIQTLAVYRFYEAKNTVNIHFSGNTAEHGSNMFGGLLDRCVPSSFAEVYRHEVKNYYDGVSYLQHLSNIKLDSIASPPVRVCFCNNESEPDCSYQPPTIKVKKGEAFNVSLVAVDQVNHSVVANIISSLAQDGGFSEDQQTQMVGKNCTNLTFNVFSPSDSESINLFADGPCGSSELSIRNLDVHFLKCTCPVGFQPNSGSVNRCECICNSTLSPYITHCNINTTSIIRENTNAWITYINDTDPPGYVIHPNCPFDYCQPQTINISIDLNLPNGADAQCAYNRTRTLCGACQEHLSLSLGSSRCLPCPSHWPAVFVVILLAAIITGILLVIALLALNMTVAVGLINGFIFYANIMSASSAVFFPSSEPSFPTVFVAWLNLDFGFDVCFFDGLDAYIKTWLQLAFPVYIISLVVVIVVVAEYSPKFAILIGRRDPVATLATLILLSYAKLVSITIKALSFAVIDYPDGSQETVWLPDGNVKYFRGKHAALVIVAFFIILVGVPYTILLLLWQWIVRAPRWNIFKWTRNTKLNAFIAAYHVPYNSRYRYWTGLLLLVRVILYIIASLTVSDKPQVSLLATIILIVGLYLFKGGMGVKMFKKSIIDIVETIVYFNLIALAAFSQYEFKTDPTKQTAVAYTSTITILLLLVGVIAYHMHLLIRKEKTTTELNQHIPAPASNKKVTYSTIEIPKPQHPPPDSDEEELITDDENRPLLTPPYQ